MTQTQLVPQTKLSSTSSPALLQFILIVGISLGIYVLALSSQIDNTLSDSKLTLLVSQALSDYGTIDLTPYQNDDILGRSLQWYVNMGDINQSESGAYHHYFPVGPSILSLPFVTIARAFDLDMRTADNGFLQRHLAAASLLIVFWVLVRLGTIYTDPTASIVIALAGILGTTLISTLATAFWSHNFAIIAISLALLLLALHSENKLPSDKSTETKILTIATPIVLGIFLFLAFFARASTAAFIAPVLVYLLLRDWRFGLIVASTSAILFTIFLYGSYLTFGSWFPDYYSATRLTIPRQPVIVGFIGNLFSPSRGVFVFGPALILAPVGLILFWKQIQRKSLILSLVLWCILNALLAATAVKWWGGWSYGARLMADVVPGLILLLFILWGAVQKQAALATRRSLIQPLLIAAFFLFSTVGIAINSYQGLFNHAVMNWYTRISPTPAIHTRHAWGDMFRWDYAQFLATEQRVCNIDADKSKTYLDAPLPLGVLPLNSWMSFHDSDILSFKTALDPSNHTPQPFFVGWENAEADWRWSMCPEARIIFELADIPNSEEVFMLTIRVYALVPQRVSLYFNDVELTTADWHHDSPQHGEMRFMLNRSDLNAFSRNDLRFVFPNVNSPETNDHRLLGVGFAGMKITEIQPIKQ